MGEWLLVGWLIAGVVTQVLLMLMPLDRESLAFMGLLAVFSLCGLVTPLLKGRAPDAMDAVISAGLFVVLVATFKRDRLLPRIAEGALFLWTPLFLYALSTAIARDSSTFRIVSLLCASALAVVATVRTITPGYKLALYVWFLLLLVGVAYLQFRAGDIDALVNGRLASLGQARLFLDGMGMTYLAVYASYLVFLVPIPGRSQSWKDRMRKWHDDADAMKAHVDDARIGLVAAIWTLAIVAGLVALNDRYGILSPWPLINLLLVAYPYAWLISKMLARHRGVA